jgi:hypothetical protein
MRALLSQMRSGSEPLPRAWTAALILAGLGSALLFLLDTDQRWEDFYIAYRHSVNLAEGRGLTYQVGTRIQGFSSPLAVLLGAAAHAASISASPDVGPWLVRLCGLAAFVGALWFLISVVARSCESPRFAATTAALLLLLESKSVAFSVNGMETGFGLLLVGALLWALHQGRYRPWLLGALGAGLLWVRLDAIVLLAALGAAVLLFGEGPRRRALVWLLQSASTCALLYAPWFAFAWAYYGSPLPQTILAKMPAGPWYAGGLAWFAGKALVVLALPLLPAYAEFGGWHAWLIPAALIGALGVSRWTLPTSARTVRQASFAACAGWLYLFLIPVTRPWYFPVVWLLMLPALGETAAGIVRARAGVASRVLATIAVLAIPAAGFLRVDFEHLARVTSRVAEWQHRRVIGQWLAPRVTPSERVYVECPGYIGFFSNARIVDYPGLVAPEVVAARARFGDDIAAVGIGLQPEWMVLRPVEVRAFMLRMPDFLPQHYRAVQVFDVRSELRAELPDHPEVLYDGMFIAMRRTADAGP